MINIFIYTDWLSNITLAEDHLDHTYVDNRGVVSDPIGQVFPPLSVCHVTLLFHCFFLQCACRV